MTKHATICQLLVMAKAPVAGRVKTRLMPTYGATQAAWWYEQMLSSVLRQAQRLFDQVWLAVDHIHHPFFQNTTLPLLPQGDGDLGERLQRVISTLARHNWLPTIVIGADSPHMQDARLLTTAMALQEVDVVIGPVEDGGYNVIAMRQPQPCLFEAIDWGSGHVQEQTMQRIDQQALRCHVLPMDYDVDTADDLARARTDGWLPQRPDIRVANDQDCSSYSEESRSP